ncbi:MAG: lipopolysaccharide biosynthesis protein [Propioniciclava sp.]
MTEPPARVARDAAWSTVGVLFSGGTQFLTSLLVARLGGPALLGILRGSLSLANLATLLWPSTAGPAASLFLARERAAAREEAARGAARHLALTSIGVAILLAPVAAWLSVVLFGLSWVDAAWVAALTVALSAYHLARGLRFGAGQVRRAATWEIICSGVAIMLLVGVLMAGWAGWILAPLVAGNLLYSAGAWLAVFRGPASTSAEQLREIHAFVSWGVAGTVASAGLMQLSMILAKTQSDDVVAGFYAAAISLATPLSMVARAVSMAIFPEMARQRGRNEPAATRATTDRATRGLVALMTPLFCALILVADPLVALVYGPGFAGAILPLRVLLVAVWLLVLPVPSVNAINVAGPAGIRLSALLSWAGLLVGLTSMAVWSLTAGIVGIAAGYLAGVATTSISSFGYVWHRDRQPWGRIVGWATALMTITVAAAAWFRDPLTQPGLALAAGVGILLLAAAALRLLLPDLSRSLLALSSPRRPADAPTTAEHQDD